MARLEITTSIGCPPACEFCPQKPLVSNYKSSAEVKKRCFKMSLETFTTCIKKLPQHYEISFSGMSEPFANENCIEMIEIAINLKKTIHIFTTLIGLRPEHAEKLALFIKTGLIKRTVLHLPDVHGNMSGFKVTNDYLYALEEILPLKGVSSMCMSKYSDIDINLMKKIKSSTKFKDIVSKLPRSSFIAQSRAKNIQFFEAVTPTNHNSSYAVTCSKTPFYDEPVLLPDGTVVLCCQDYSLQHQFGNLLFSNFQDIITSKEREKLLEANSGNCNENQSSSLCRQCEFASYWKHENGVWTEIKANKQERLIDLLKIGKRKVHAAKKVFKHMVLRISPWQK